MILEDNDSSEDKSQKDPKLWLSLIGLFWWGLSDVRKNPMDLRSSLNAKLVNVTLLYLSLSHYKGLHVIRRALRD